MQEANFFQEYLPYLPALATLVVGVVASTIAIVAIYSNRQLSKKKNSLETILAVKGDEQLRKAISVIHDTHKDPDTNIETYAYAKYASDDISKKIRYALNFYEYLAVGIHKKVYDESILKESMYTTMITVHSRCEAFIDTIRRDGHETALCHFESLAKRWINKPLKKAKK